MAVLDLFRRKRAPVLMSRPIFQHASSFLSDDEDENDDKKHVPLPLFHEQHGSCNSEKMPQTKPQSRLHLILHILNLIFTVVSACLFVAVIPIWDANYQHSRSVISSDYTDGIVLAPLALSILFSIYLLVREHTVHRICLPSQLFNKKAATNPPTPTPLKQTTLALLCLTILLTLAPALTLSATNSLALIWRAPTRTKQGTIVCNLVNVFTQQCQPVLYQIGGLQIGGVVVGALVWLVWSVILAVAIRVWARERMKRVREANERRRRRREERVGRRQRHEHRRRKESIYYARGSTEHKTWHGQEKNVKDLENGSRGDYRSVTANTRGHNVPFDKCRYGSRNDRDNGRGRDRGPAGARAGSLAAQMACRKVQPKETIQVWLHNRHRQSQ